MTEAAAKRDTLPAPHCTCMGDILEKLEALQTSVDGVIRGQRQQAADIATINNYLHNRQVRADERETARIAALPPVFEPVPDDDTPTNPGR